MLKELKNRPSRAYWASFNKSVGRSRGDVGIWHETYRVAAGQYEAVYSGMPSGSPPWASWCQSQVPEIRRGSGSKPPCSERALSSD
jgi:hypothetical protein